MRNSNQSRNESNAINLEAVEPKGRSGQELITSLEDSGVDVSRRVEYLIAKRNIADDHLRESGAEKPDLAVIPGGEIGYQARTREVREYAKAYFGDSDMEDEEISPLAADAVLVAEAIIGGLIDLDNLKQEHRIGDELIFFHEPLDDSFDDSYLLLRLYGFAENTTLSLAATPVGRHSPLHQKGCVFIDPN